MAQKALSIANGLASLFSAGSRQGDPPKQEKDQPLVERMVRQADPEKRKQASDSLAKAFK